MPTSTSSFGEFTPGQDVVSSYADQVKGKIILITGANPGGIGLTTATSLAAASPKLLILAGRSHEKFTQTAEAVQKVNPNVVCKPVLLDLGSQQSVRKAAEEILADTDIPQIDILINNAGIMNLPERTLSPEGIELQFATNHIGHYLFTNLILSKIKVSASSSKPGSTRIINLSSRAVLYSPVRFSDYNFTKQERDIPEEEHMTQSTRQLWNVFEDKPYVPQAAYGQSKSANVLFSVELNKRLFASTGILSVAVHPGAIDTQLARSMDPNELKAAFEAIQQQIPDFRRKDLDAGCSTTLVAALDPQLTETDIFFSDCQVANWTPAYATDSDKAKGLWELSEKLVGQTFSA